MVTKLRKQTHVFPVKMDGSEVFVKVVAVLL
jgi:hypothetical protein